MTSKSPVIACGAAGSLDQAPWHLVVITVTRTPSGHTGVASEAWREGDGDSQGQTTLTVHAATPLDVCQALFARCRLLFTRESSAYVIDAIGQCLSAIPPEKEH